MILPHQTPPQSACLQTLKQLVVVGVRTDPEPDHRVTFDCSQSAIADSNSGGEDRRLRTDPLETQPGMRRVLCKEPVGFTSLTLGSYRQRGKEISETLCRMRNHNLSGFNS